MRNRILLTLVGFGLSAFLMGSATMAWFTAGTSVSNNTFSSGTIKIGANINDGHGNQTWTGTYGNMAPGQTVTTQMKVQNIGTLTMKYKMYSSYTGDQGLADTLDLLITDPANGNATLYSGKLSAFSGSDNQHLVIRDGSNEVAAEGSQMLNMSVSLPISAGNAVAGKSVTVTFVFEATQPQNSGWSQ